MYCIQSVHQWPPGVEQVAPRIRRFGLVTDDVRERGLYYLPRVTRPLGRPVPERRPEAMRHGSDPQLIEQLRQPRVGQLLAARAGKDQPGALRRCRACAQALGRMQHLNRAGAQRYAVLASRLHPRRRDRHTAASKSISSHRAPRASPGLTAVSTMNSKQSFVPAHADEAFTVAMAPATSPCGSAGRCRT